MSSHNHQLSPELRINIWTVALIVTQEMLLRRDVSRHARHVREVLYSNNITATMNRVNLAAHRLGQLHATRHYSELAQQHLATITRLSEELNFTLAAVNEIFTASTEEIKGHNVQLLANLLYYAGNDQPVNRILETITVRYETFVGAIQLSMEVLYEQLNSYGAAVCDITSLQDELEGMILL